MAFSIRSEVLCLALFLLPGVVSAASASEKAAKAAALEAKKAFDLNDFPTAIAKYEEAYKLKSAPGLLFNLGQSHRRAGNLDRATFYFRRYLETNPPAAQAKATEEVLALVEAQLARAKTTQAQTEGAEAERKKVEEQRKHEAEEQRRTLELEKTRLEVAHAQRAALEASLKAPATTPVTQRWWFLTGIGAVVIGGAVAATLVATAPQPVQTTFPDINAR